MFGGDKSSQFQNFTYIHIYKFKFMFSFHSYINTAWFGGGEEVSVCANMHTAKIMIITRIVRKSDYTPALALPKHMAGIFDEKCREKEKYREEQIGECPFLIPHHNLSL